MLVCRLKWKQSSMPFGMLKVNCLAPCNWTCLVSLFLNERIDYQLRSSHQPKKTFNANSVEKVILTIVCSWFLFTILIHWTIENHHPIDFENAENDSEQYRPLKKCAPNLWISRSRNRNYSKIQFKLETMMLKIRIDCESETYRKL